MGDQLLPSRNIAANIVSKGIVRLILAFVVVAGLYVTGSCSHREAASRTEAKVSRQEVLLDLHKNAPTLHVRELTALPDSVLPELDNHFAQHAARNPWLFGHLLARYGTASVLQQVRDIYNRDHLRWGCDSRFPFLAYFLRVNSTEGARVLRAALQERKGNGCFRSMLSSVSRIFPAAEIEAVAIDALDDADPEVGANAAMTLSWHGSPAAEPHLWSSLQRWTKRWRDRPPQELYGDPETGDGRQYGEIRLGDSLRGAIVTAQAWYFDESRRRRLYALCWTQHCRTQFEEVSPPPTVRIRVHQLMYDEPRFEVGWYHPDSVQRFRDKIVQFPMGTTFGWCTDREGGGQLTKREAAVWRKQTRQVVESQGFGFLDEPPAGSCSTDEKGP